MKFQIEIRFSVELHGNSKLSMTSCPPSSAFTEDCAVNSEQVDLAYLLSNIKLGGSEVKKSRQSAVRLSEHW